jgi:DNA-binding NarL/FixJ family response regulator
MDGPVKNREIVRSARPLVGSATVRVLIVDGNEFRRDSLASLLSLQSRVNVKAVASETEETLKYLRHKSIDVVIADIEAPPRGAVPLFRLARAAPADIGFIVLADLATPEFASELLNPKVEGIGILGRPNIKSTTELVSAIELVAVNGTAISPELVSMLAGQSDGDASIRISNLTPREREILAGIARGLNNRAVATELGIRVRTVENMIGNILQKLGERGHPDHNGRVCAALFYLKATGQAALGA